jgi:hypothetical protein
MALLVRDKDGREWIQPDISRKEVRALSLEETLKYGGRPSYAEQKRGFGSNVKPKKAK